LPTPRTIESAVLDAILTGAEKSFLHRGIDDTTFSSVSELSGVPVSDIQILYPTTMDLVVAMLNREFRAMYAGIISNIERDPQGGLLSRSYTYIFSEVYERPVARALFLVERNALHEIMRHEHGQMYVPSLTVQKKLVVGLKNAGMIKPEAHPGIIAQEIGVISGGLAITAPHHNLGELVTELMTLVGERYDAEVFDTSPGKAVLYSWATGLDTATQKTR
jgi:AcrR family transcriptional regulator